MWFYAPVLFIILCILVPVCSFIPRPVYFVTHCFILLLSWMYPAFSVLKLIQVKFETPAFSHAPTLRDRCSISSSFQNSLKTSGLRGCEFLEFWCWNLVPFLPDIGFQLLKSFSFNDAPNVLYRWKIWTAGRPIQHLDSSTTKPCCCNSCSMWFWIVLLKYTSPSLK